MAKDLNVEELKRTLERARGQVKDVHLGGEPEPEKTPQQLEESTKAEDIKADKMASLMQRLADLEARERSVEQQEAEFAKLKKRWVDGDYSDLPPNHPFELLIHTDTSGMDPNPVVTLDLNGNKIDVLRGVATKVPHNYVQHLDKLKYDYVTKEVGPNGFPIAVLHRGHRFAFTAHPVYGDAS
jgi:hypothetical protein